MSINGKYVEALCSLLKEKSHRNDQIPPKKEKKTATYSCDKQSPFFSRDVQEQF